MKRLFIGLLVFALGAAFSSCGDDLVIPPVWVAVLSWAAYLASAGGLAVMLATIPETIPMVFRR